MLQAYLLRFAIVILELSLRYLVLPYLRTDILDVGNRPVDLRDLGRPLQSRYHYIIVGGGTAGSVLANRLTEDPDVQVLLLEAGEDELPLSDVPAAFHILPKSEVDWGFRTEPQQNSCQSMYGNVSLWPRGKALGGSSTINAMIYIRGNRRDYDGWAALGLPGWSYQDVLPYFKKSEDMRVEALRGSEYHGVGGPLSVEHYKHYTNASRYFLDAAQELGLRVGDVNGAEHTGAMLSQGTLRDGLRCSAAKAFLRPAARRPNLHISTRSVAQRLELSKSADGALSAAGVRFLRDGAEEAVQASEEVILSAGAVQSPQLLMVSGIGPVDHLRQVGIEPVLDLPGVGGNLQDHIGLAGMLWLIDEPVSFLATRAASVSSMLSFIRKEGGSMYGLTVGEVMTFVNTKYANASEDFPDVQLFLASGTDASDYGVVHSPSLGLDRGVWNEVFGPVSMHEGMTCLPLVLRPRSRGTVRVTSPSMQDHPVIQPNYLSHEHDVNIIVDGAKICRNLMGTSVMKKLNARINPNKFPACRHLEFMSDDYIACQARQYSMTIYHPVGTCSMGPAADPEAVLDERLRVRGVRGLRVVDASAMPRIPSGNTMAPTIMLAEKAADMIKEDRRARHLKDMKGSEGPQEDRRRAAEVGPTQQPTKDEL